MKKFLVFCMLITLVFSIFNVSFAAAQEDEFLTTITEMYDEIESVYRPEVRWWVSSGQDIDETLTSSMEYLESVGFGGVEVLTKGREVTDRVTYGWGSQEWYDDTVLTLQTAVELGMNYSFTSGSDYQPAIPGINADSEEASAELDFNWAVVSAGETYSGEIPYPTTEPAVAEAGVADAKNAGWEDRAVPFSEQKFLRAVVAKLDGDYVDGPTTLLYSDSLTDVTDLVAEVDGTYTIDWTAPDDGDYMLFTFWYHGTGQDVPSSNEVMYMINNFGEAGALAQIEYWDEYIFTDEVQALIDELNAQGLSVDFFQDSPEVENLKSWRLYWSEDVLDEFEARRGYDLTPYLPLIIQYDIFWGPTMAAATIEGEHSWLLIGKFDVSDDDLLRFKVMQDYEQTLSEINAELYLQTIKDWLNEKGVNLRTQASYGLFTEMSYADQVADDVEYESLGGVTASSVEGFAKKSGAVHLYNKEKFSSETAGYGNYCGYSVTLEDYLSTVNFQFVAGVNRTLFHGYASIATPSEDVGWPGSLGYSMGFLNNWGERNPNGEYLSDFTEYMGRTQKMLRQGTAKIDLGVLQLVYQADGEYDSDVLTALRTSGYTYDYFTPLFLTDETAVFVNEDGTIGYPEYQALVVFQDHFPYEGAEVLLDLAAQGVPLLIVEGAAIKTPYNDGQDEALQAIFEQLRTMDSVVYIDSMADTEAGLAELGITSRVSYDSTDTYIYLREADEAAYLFLFNGSETDAAETTVSIEGLYTPYSMDLWTGEVVQLAEYSYVDGRTVIPVSLAAEDSAAIVLDYEAETEATVVSSNADSVYSADGVVYATVSDSGDYTVTFSDGTEATFSAETFDTIELNEWELTVEQWTAGEVIEISEDKYDYTTIEYYATTDKTDISVSLSELVSWTYIEELGDTVSGIGYYSTTFTIPEGWSETDGAYLDLGQLIEATVVYINGVQTDSVSLLDNCVDISDYLQIGENTIEVICASTLGNYALSLGLMTEGQGWGTVLAGVVDYGLTGPVVIVPYKTIVVK